MTNEEFEAHCAELDRLAKEHRKKNRGKTKRNPRYFRGYNSHTRPEVILPMVEAQKAERESDEV